MCGLAGFFDLIDAPDAHRDEPRTLAKMLDQLLARGPDASAVWHDGPVHFAHCRLSIIDLSQSSQQPLRLENDDFVIVYNGEVYNYKALRKELELAGDRFFSTGDTEVVLRGFSRYGTQWLKHLNGMFAAAVWDRREEQLTLFRDRFGIKPLYWSVIGGTLVFASQVKALLQYPGIRAKLNLNWLNEYLTFQYVHGPITPFEGIYLLQAGSSLVFNQESLHVEETLWAPQRSYRPDYGLSFENATDLVTGVFNSAVSNSLVSDVPIGSYLSGGIDSGAVVTVAKQWQDGLNTFTCGFDDPGLSIKGRTLDETERARTVASVVGCKFHHINISPKDILQMHVRVIETIEEPRLGVLYQNDSAAKLASTVVRVCLSGAGGDELFGGYPWRYRTVRHARSKDEFVRGYYGFWQRAFSDEEKAALLRPDVLGQTDLDLAFNTFAMQFPQDVDYRDTGVKTWLCLKYECDFFLHALLQVGDRLAGAYGLEERFPFLDNDLVALVDIIPAEYHWDPDEDPVDGKYLSGKRLLRNALSKLVSPRVATLPKQGFTLPIQEWFQGPLSEFVAQELFDHDARILNYLKPEAVDLAIDNGKTGRSVSGAQVWSLLSVETMLKVFFD